MIYCDIITRNYKKALCVSNFTLLLRCFLFYKLLKLLGFFQIIHYNINISVYVLQISDRRLSFVLYINHVNY